MAKFIVGLTGGIGSGKSAAARIFGDLGIKIVEADDAGRVVVEPGTPALFAIKERFGAQICQTDGTLDRAKLRKIVFADATQRDWLQSLLRPLIARHMRDELDNATSEYVILANAVLLETQQQQWCNRVLVIDAPENIQLERTMLRDNNTPEQVASIMATQMSRTERLKLADDVIVNDATLQALTQAVHELHRKYSALCQTPRES
jgi:dephospho-CoA kinase